MSFFKSWLRIYLPGAIMLWTTPVHAIPLDTIGTFCGTFPDQCRKGTTSLLAARGSGTNAYYVLEIDPTTGAIPVSASFTPTYAGATGAAVPVNASYTGLNSSGTLIGAVGDSSGRIIVVGPGVAGTPAGGVQSVQGVASGTALPISAASLPLPTGAATETTLAAQSAKLPATLGQKAMAASMAVTIASDQTAVSTTSTNFPATVAVNSGAVTSSTIRVVAATDATQPVGRSYGDSVRYTYSTAAVTTAAWVQMIASTAAAINCMQIFDSSGQTLILGVGGAGAEVTQLIISPGGLDGCVPLRIPASSRVSLKALSATTGAIGEFNMTGFN